MDYLAVIGSTCESSNPQTNGPLIKRSSRDLGISLTKTTHLKFSVAPLKSFGIVQATSLMVMIALTTKRFSTKIFGKSIHIESIKDLPIAALLRKKVRSKACF